MMSTDIVPQPKEDNFKESIRLDLQEQGIRTLGDFVDEASIIEVSARADQAYTQLLVRYFLSDGKLIFQVVKDRVIELTDFLIRKINEQVSAITKLKGDADTQALLIQDRLLKVKTLLTDLHRLFKSVERSYQQLDQDTSALTSEQQIQRLSQALTTVLTES